MPHRANVASQSVGGPELSALQLPQQVIVQIWGFAAPRAGGMAENVVTFNATGRVAGEGREDVHCGIDRPHCSESADIAGGEHVRMAKDRHIGCDVVFHGWRERRFLRGHHRVADFLPDCVWYPAEYLLVCQFTAGLGDAFQLKSALPVLIRVEQLYKSRVQQVDRRCIKKGDVTSGGGVQEPV